jgi:hypothetical protein
MLTLIPILPDLASKLGRHRPTRDEVTADRENWLMDNVVFSAYTKHY